MSSKSNDLGRAYEFAWIQALYSALLSKKQNVKIIENSSFKVNSMIWANLVSNSIANAILTNENGKNVEFLHVTLTQSAEAAIKTLFEIEPLLTGNSDTEISLEFQNDRKGESGDVRDILIKRDDIQWEIGLSIKHNHEAIAHNRISNELDFGKKWYDHSCSDQYWNTIKHIFEKLYLYKSEGKKWSDLPDKKSEIYIPLLKAFIDEVYRAYEIDKELPRKMIEYLIGIKDYYKIISKDKKRLTIIRTFNIHGTLNRPHKLKVSTITVPIVELPTKLIDLSFKENHENTVEMILNNGWDLSFRIHNASTYVEPSLKFDIQFVGMPVSILSFECRWTQDNLCC